MKNFRYYTSALMLIGALIAPHVSAESTPRIVRYQGDATWAHLPDDRAWGRPSGLAVDPDGESIWVFERCGGNSCADSHLNPIIKLNAAGKAVRSFGADLFVFPHGMEVDRSGNIYVADGDSDGRRGHQVFKFSPAGKILLTLGKAGVAGEGNDDTLNRPADIAVAPNGDIFVADGHAPRTKTMRIVKFSADGRFIKSWGNLGSAPGQLNDPHSLAFDSQGRLFVADRVNKRIQIFDQDGKFIAAWTQFGVPSGLFITPDDKLYVADSGAGIRIGSARDGSVETFLRVEDNSAEIRAAESVVVDRHGNIFAGENSTKRLLKLPPVSQ